MSGNFTRNTLILLSTLFLVSCASQPQKARERYAGVDSVETATPQMIIGSWLVRMTNATEDEKESWANTGMRSVSTFNGDGTMVNVTSSESMGLELETSGNWSLSGSMLNLAATSSKNLSSNPLGAIAASFLTSFKDQMSGTANIYEAASDRLVVVNEEEGVAIEYIRIQ